SAGDVFVTGMSETTYHRYDFYTAKYAGADGAFLWEKRFTGPGGNAVGRAVAADAAGNVFVTGLFDGIPDSSATDFRTAKYAGTNRALLWEKTYTGPGNGVENIETNRQFA